MAVLKYKKQDGSYATLTNISIKGIEPVQVTGNSTTDVMSQNAVTTYLNTKADTATTYTKNDTDLTFLSKTDASSTYVAQTAGVTGGSYDSNSKLITLYHADGTSASTIDCTDFIKDGMVDNVVVSGGNLNIIFNTDAGKQKIEIPISDIFDASNYYTKNDLTGSSTTVVVTKANSANTASTVALAGVTGLQTALENKADYSGLTAHTSDSTIHVTSTDKTSWNNAATDSHTHSNKTVLDGIDSNDITNWNAVYGTMHSHGNMSVLSGISSSDINTWNAVTDKANQSDLTAHTANSTVHITATERTNWDSAYGTTSGITATTAAINSLTGVVGTMAFANAASYSSATEVETALGAKANTATTVTAASGLTGSGNLGSNIILGLEAVEVGNYTGSAMTTYNVSYDEYGRVSSACGTVYSAMTISGNQTNVTCPDAITGSSKSGWQANVVYVNGTSTDYTVAVSTSSGYKTPDNSEVKPTCKGNGYCEINYLNIGGVIYVRGV